jgi:hypothetical protein
MYIKLYMCSKNGSTFEEVLCVILCVAVVPMSRLGKLCNCSKSSDKNSAHLIVLSKRYKVNPNLLLVVSLCRCIFDQTRESVAIALQIETPKRERDVIKIKNVSSLNLGQFSRAKSESATVTEAFGFIDADSFRYYNILFTIPK